MTHSKPNDHDLRGADLSGKDLSGADPTGASMAKRVRASVTDTALIAANKMADIARSAVPGAAAGAALSHEALKGFAANLDWSTIDPGKYLHAGARGVSRGLAEARLVWKTIPEPLRTLGPEDVAKHLDGFDWSHIRPFSKGGSNKAANGVFERAGLNRSRGARTMTPAELQAAHQVLSDTAFRAVLEATARKACVAGVAGAASGCVFACLEHGLEYQRGDITRDELYRRIGRATGRSAAAGAGLSGLMTVMALAFPPLIPVAAHLAIPMAVLGFCAVGGKTVRLGAGWYELLKGARKIGRIAPATTPSRREIRPEIEDGMRR